MSWKFVFNTNNLPLGIKFESLKETVFNAGYQFFLWQGDVYFMDEDGIEHITKLKHSDLV